MRSWHRYEGTFNDFNDRAVQFGYLVLFAPAFSLAPLLALLNNIVEIRSSAYRLVKGYARARTQTDIDTDIRTVYMLWRW